LFCGEEKCEEQIKFDAEGTTARCIPLDSKPVKGKCVKCGKEANNYVYFSKR
jgi:prolyl-tRNA synthetase